LDSRRVKGKEKARRGRREGEGQRSREAEQQRWRQVTKRPKLSE
jgi:hypothetical protein